MPNRRNLLKHIPAGLGAIALGGTGISLSTAATPAPEGPRHFVLLVIDRSGSMMAVRDAVVDGVNKFLDEQKNNTGMQIGIVQFDSQKTADNCFCEQVFGFTPAANTPRLAPNDFQPRGGTPLLAAFVEAVSKMEQIIRPIDRVLINVQTDGAENSSPAEITLDVVKALIKSKETEGNWTFSFMGADIDAWGVGGSVGVAAGSTLQYANTYTGTTGAYLTTSSATSNWYTSTAGGASAAVAMASPSNTNSSFYTDLADDDTAKKIAKQLNKKKDTDTTA